MSYQCIIKSNVGNGGHKTAVESGVIAPKTSVRIDGDDGRDDLGSEKQNDGNIQRGFGDFEFLIEVGLNGP